MTVRPLGILANPASGKDIRRLVARASVFDNQEKRAIVRRVLLGALNVGVRQFRFLDDRHGITRGAIEEVAATRASQAIDALPVDATDTASTLDTISAARALADAGCGATVVLGGDGTNRAFCLGWRCPTLVPLSTGTNNVFPALQEATIAGAAAGLVATGRIPQDAVSRRNKVVVVRIEGEADDLALIDAVVTRERFIGARALLSPDDLVLAVLTRADPAAVGMTAIGGLLSPMADEDETGMAISFGSGGDRLDVPIAPGYYRSIAVRSLRTLRCGEPVTATGPGVLAFDGERERTLKPGQTVTMHVERTGPWVVDVAQTLHHAARLGLFRTPSPDSGA